LLRLEEGVLVVHPDNPHAMRDSVALEQLREATFLVAPETLAPGYNEALVGFCAGAGFTPTTLTAPGLHAPPTAPPDDWVILLTPGAVSAMQLDFEPVFVPVDPPCLFRIEIIWRPDTPHDLLDSFQAASDQVAQRERWSLRGARS
jgi:hypothetical protein